MPPKRRDAKKVTDAKDGIPQAKKPCISKPKAKKSGPYKMPPPLPAGEIIHDTAKRSWKLGVSVGKGGFGEIYRAAPLGPSASSQIADHVIKIEPHENGPLFCEIAFYCRVAKPELIDRWVSSRKLSYLAIPKCISQGVHLHGEQQYRFLVMPYFGEDIEKKFNSCGRQFGMKTVCYLALRLLEALHFLHDSDYVHADIKGSNLVTGRHPSQQHEVYLVDYGLAYRYFSAEEKHKEYKEDPRRKHDGTTEFTSIDAHRGVKPSRRGDLEILGYCLLQWLAGQLPWEHCLQDKDQVTQLKDSYRTDVEGLMKACFGSKGPKCFRDYMGYVYGLGYQDTPDYKKMQQMFLAELSSHGLKDDGKNLDWCTSAKGASCVNHKVAEDYEDGFARGAKLKQKRKLPPAAPEQVGKASSEPSTKRKKQQAVAAVPPINEDKTTSDSKEMLVPLGYYPSELGYANNNEVANHNTKDAGKKSQRTKKLPPKNESKSVLPVRTSPRLACKQKTAVNKDPKKQRKK